MSREPPGFWADPSKPEDKRVAESELSSRISPGSRASPTGMMPDDRRRSATKGHAQGLAVEIDLG